MGSDEYFTLTEDIRLDLIEVLGRGYVIDHCIASLRKRNRDLAYRMYVTDTLRIIAENTAKFSGGSYITTRFSDIVDPQPRKPEMTSKQVISKIKDKLKGGALDGRNEPDGKDRT